MRCRASRPQLKRDPLGSHERPHVRPATASHVVVPHVWARSCVRKRGLVANGWNCARRGVQGGLLLWERGHHPQLQEPRPTPGRSGSSPIPATPLNHVEGLVRLVFVLVRCFCGDAFLDMTPCERLPNKRLKLASGDRFKGSGVLCPWRGTDV